MRRNIIYILLLCLPVCLPIAAKTSSNKPQSIHYITFWGGGGYSGLTNHYKNNSFVGGGGGLLGIGYEYRFGHLIVDAGAEFRAFSSLDKVTISSINNVPQVIDGLNMTKHFSFDTPLRETHVVGQAMVPLMIGGRWDALYFLVGAKAGSTVVDNYRQRGSYSITVSDLDAYDPNWANMPSHGALADVPYSSEGKVGYGLDITASAEVGVSINGLLGRGWSAINDSRKHPLHMRVAVFADYGVLSLGQAAQGQMVTADESGLSSRSLHTSDWAQGSLNSLMVGVKFTALLQLNKPQKPKQLKPLLVLYVLDEQSNRGVPSATVALTQTDADKPRTVRRVTNAKGVLAAKMPVGLYDLHVSHPDYKAESRSMEHGLLGDTLSVSLTLLPRPLPRIEHTEEVNEQRVMVLQRLFFAPNKTTILPQSEQALQDLYSLLIDNPNMHIRIIGHTDALGSEETNQRLSEGRANSVRNDLIRRGIKADRIEAEGKGESEPITTNETEEGRAQNRRVEFVITSMEDEPTDQ